MLKLVQTGTLSSIDVTFINKIIIISDITSLQGYPGLGATSASSAATAVGHVSAGAIPGGLAYPVTSDRTPGSANNEQTLKSLQKHYMNAITSLNPQLPHNV